MAKPPSRKRVVPAYLYPSGIKDASDKLRDFVADNEIATLNVAGPRASKEPEVAEFVKVVLEEAFPT